MNRVAHDDSMVWLARLWNAILGLITLAWFALLAYITVRLALQGAWGSFAIAGIIAILLLAATIARVEAVRRADTTTAGLDAFAVVLTFLGIEAKK